MPGLGQPLEQIPAPVQTAKSQEILRSNATDLAGFMNRFLGSVYVNDIQGNPFQADVTYRGYVASPLLGTPQGLSVYMDGVRLNQPFGDVVSWDLIPLRAISSIALQPGSNPLFGLNTLGGALSMETKDGRSNPGTVLQGTYGQYGRESVLFESGAAWDNGIDVYATGTLFREDGWRDDSPSRVGQIFGKVGWRGPLSSAYLTLAYADNDLTGNGLQEQRFLARDYASVYTKPDTTDNRALFINLVGQHTIKEDVLVSGNVFYRNIKTSTFNGDINEESLDQALYQPNAAEQAALAAAGYIGYPSAGESASNTPFPYWRCIANALLNEEPNEKCNGLLNRTNTSQSNWGTSGQVTFCAEPGWTAEPADRGRVVRRESRHVHAVLAVRLPDAGACGRRCRRLRRRNPEFRGCVRCPRQPGRHLEHAVVLRDRHAASSASPGASRCRGGTTVRAWTTRIN